MTPDDVTVTSGERGVVLWTRIYAGQPVTVGYIPASDPVARRQQEDDLARHLDERTGRSDA